MAGRKSSLNELFALFSPLVGFVSSVLSNYDNSISIQISLPLLLQLKTSRLRIIDMINSDHIVSH